MEGGCRHNRGVGPNGSGVYTHTPPPKAQGQPPAHSSPARAALPHPTPRVFPWPAGRRPSSRTRRTAVPVTGRCPRRTAARRPSPTSGSALWCTTALASVCVCVWERVCVRASVFAWNCRMPSGHPFDTSGGDLYVCVVCVYVCGCVFVCLSVCVFVCAYGNPANLLRLNHLTSGCGLTGMTP